MVDHPALQAPYWEPWEMRALQNVIDRYGDRQPLVNTIAELDNVKTRICKCAESSGEDVIGILIKTGATREGPVGLNADALTSDLACKINACLRTDWSLPYLVMRPDKLIRSNADSNLIIEEHMLPIDGHPERKRCLWVRSPLDSKILFGKLNPLVHYDYLKVQPGAVSLARKICRLAMEAYWIGPGGTAPENSSKNS